MLPSTGYFKSINCPFYESGTCDRPYCHFKHAKREDATSSVLLPSTAEARTSEQAQEPKSSDSNVLRLVTEAVKKVLANHEVTDTEKLSGDVVSQVVGGLAPDLSGASNLLDTMAPDSVGKHLDMPVTITKPISCVYNPTPISELKKRHIPIASYMPTREIRPAVKRKSSPDKTKPWGIINESIESHVPKLMYKPTAIGTSNEQNYIPAGIPESLLDEDSNPYNGRMKLKEAYYPKSKKRREEYVPKKVKAPLTTMGQSSNIALEDSDSKFDLMDEIFISNTKTVNVPLSEESQGSTNVEPKFSDDEEPMMDNTVVAVKEEETTNYLETMDNKSVDIDDNGDEDKKMEKKEQHRKASVAKPYKKAEDKNGSSPMQQNVQCKGKESKEVEVRKNTEERKKEHKKRGRSRSKERKSSSTSHKSSKHKHRDRESSKEYKRSSSSNKDKDRNRDNHQCKDSSSRKDKHSTSEKYKSDHHKSDKHRRKDSGSSISKSSKNEKRSSSDKSRQKHHSESGHRSSKHSSKKSKMRENSKEPPSDSADSEFEDIKASLHPALDDENGFTFEDILNASDSDHDVQEECLKIFQEYQVADHPKPVCIKESIKTEEDVNEEIGRKRVAHPSAATNVSRPVGPSHPLKKVATPHQKMYERWRLMREVATEKAATEGKTLQVTTGCNDVRSTELTMTRTMESQRLNGNGRIRIAPVPYARSLMLKKKEVAEIAAKIADNKAAESRTHAQTAKSGVRVAHVPQVVPQLVRPEPMQVVTQKFSPNIRQYYLNIMHDVCIQIYTNAEDAAQRAVKEEFACQEKCKALSVYKNSCMLAAHRLRKEVDQSTFDGPATSGSGMVSHEAVLAGKSKGSWSVLKTKKALTDVKGAALYNMLRKWILTEQQLKDNGFPRPHPNGQTGHAKIFVTNTRNQSVVSKVPNERICCRCGQAYTIDKQGFALRQQNCIYHWGRKFTIRGEGKYSCCQQYGSAIGCCDAKTHVWDFTDFENLRGYVKTLPKDVPADEYGVYALDCEMCYTTQGLELTRVTVIDEDCSVVYETLVQPQNSIIDYNTRFSGITEEDMKSVTTTLLDVQATLLTMFSDKTILVGHSLESDFKALKLIHDTVVDTSVMFPHKNGYPQKRALKNLCSEYLRKIIQNDVGGHDSKEDAVSCMELIIWKVKEQAKLL